MWHDLVWALIFAVIFSIVVEVLALGSRIRRVSRLVQDLLAARSLARLRKRISKVKRERELMASPQGLTLAVLSSLAMTLGVFPPMAGILIILDKLGVYPDGVAYPAALSFLIASLSGSIYATTLAFSGSEGIARLLKQRDKELSRLKLKLKKFGVEE